MEVGDIVKVDRGTWGLKEWYPGRSFKKDAAATNTEVDPSEKVEAPTVEVIEKTGSGSGTITFRRGGQIVKQIVPKTTDSTEP